MGLGSLKVIEMAPFDNHVPGHKISNSLRRENRGAEGADGVGVGRVCPLPLGVGYGEGAVPPPQKWISDIKMVSFCAFLCGIIYRLAACFARKNGVFGLPKL